MSDAWTRAEERAGLRARDDQSFTELARETSAGEPPEYTPEPGRIVPPPEEPERVRLTETRYYIGMFGDWGHVAITYPAGGSVGGTARDPRAVLELTEGCTLYPVSREVAQAWTDGEVDDI